MSFSDSLKCLRKALKVSQASAANSAGISITQYQNYEYGKSEPTASVLLALSDFFNVPLDFLCGRGVFANWDEYAARSDDLRAVISESLGVSEAALTLLDFSQFLSFIEAFFSKIEYDPVQNSFTLFPRLPPEVCRRILHAEGE